MELDTEDCTTPIERAARALWDISNKPYHGDDIVPAFSVPEGRPDWQSFVPQVAAVLEAIRETSNDMRVLAWYKLHQAEGDLNDLDIWEAMIDALLHKTVSG